MATATLMAPARGIALVALLLLPALAGAYSPALRHRILPQPHTRRSSAAIVASAAADDKLVADGNGHVSFSSTLHISHHPSPTIDQMLMEIEIKMLSLSLLSASGLCRAGRRSHDEC